jgi:pyrroloquinoline quinone biosynthesis protein E
LSGAYVTKERLIALIEAGVEGIFVSLNGSTEEINRKSRDGYSLAIKTLEYLKDLSYPETYINFVMQKSNARDLPKMMKLAEKYGVKELVIISFKPDSARRLDAFPDRAQLEEAAAFIRSYKGPVKLSVEGCFSILRALSREMFFFNLNRGIGYGCGAGRDGISVNIKGQLTPCRHLDLPEDNDSIMDYWRNSPVLKKLRSIEDMRDEPCRGCHYEKACLPCAAVANELRGDIMTGFKECPVALRD